MKHIHKLLETTEKDSPTSFINLLKLAKDPETGKTLSPHDIADKLITFFVAAYSAFLV